MKIIVKVQLSKEPPSREYTRLHALMREEGFSLSLPAAGGKIVPLPHAMYYQSESELDAEQWRDRLGPKIKSIDDDRKVLVIEMKTWAGTNL